MTAADPPKKHPPKLRQRGTAGSSLPSPLRMAFGLIRRFNPNRDRLGSARSKDGRDDGGQSALADGIADSAIRHGLLLDRLISHGSTINPKKMEREVLMCARLGVLSHLRGVPAHAAVNETVALLPANHRARGLVNAIVRRATETVRSRELTPEERATLLKGDPDAGGLVSPTSLTLSNRWLVQGDFALFPADLTERWLMLGGLPAWLGATLLETLDDSELRQVCLSSAEAPGIWFRVTARNPAAGRKALESAGCDFADELLSAKVQTAMAPSDRVPGVLNSEAFRKGWLTVQDPAAQLPASLLGVKSGWLIADFCAAPGGKTIQLAESTGANGRVLAVDDDQDRIMLVKDAVDRMGLGNVSGVCADARSVRLPDAGKYDAVLVDAPCSNTGVLGRRVEVRHRLKPADLSELPAIQAAILENAATHLRPGGVLAYSTCSLLDQENGALVRAFLEKAGGEESGWQMFDERLTLPSPGRHDGGYVAVLRAP